MGAVKFIPISYDMTYILTAIGLSPGGSTHLHTNNTKNNTNNNRTTQITTNVEECGPCPVFASFTLAFALQLRKKHGKTCQGKKNLSRVKKNLRVQHTYYQNTHISCHSYLQNMLKSQLLCLLHVKQSSLIGNYTVENPAAQSSL